MVGTLLLPFLTLTQTLDSTYDRRALWLAHGPGATGVVQGMGTQATSLGAGRSCRAPTCSRPRPTEFVPSTARRAPDSSVTPCSAGCNSRGCLRPCPITEVATIPSGSGIRNRLPVATFAVGWVGQVHATRGEDHLRRAMWWYNREFPRTVADSSRANCSYDRCALRIRPRVSSRQLVQGVAEMPLARRIRRSSCSRRRVTVPARTTTHISRSHRAPGRGCVSPDRVAGWGRTLRREPQQNRPWRFVWPAVLSYGAGHMSLYGAAQAERELDQAIWFYNRSLPDSCSSS